MATFKRLPFFYGYVIVAASFLIQAVTWGTSNSFGIFFDPFLKEFGWLRATVSGAASLSFLVYGCVSILMGKLNDRFGPRLIMSGCGLFLSLGYLLMTMVHGVWQLYVFYGLVVGIGMGGAEVIPLSTIARWFEKKRGTMSGLIKVGTGVGMVIMPIFITSLLGSHGWRTTYAVLAAVNLIFVISLAQFLVRDPAKKALFPDNEEIKSPREGNAGEAGLSFRESVRTRQFGTICVVYFIILVCVYTILMHIVQHAIDLGISTSDAASILATIGGVSVVGRFVTGWAGDRIGGKLALSICLLFLLTALCWLLLCKSMWMFYLFAATYGFAHGGFFALMSPLLARLFGTRAHGLIFGIVIFISTIGGAIGPVMAGHVFDVTSSYRIVFLILVALCSGALGLTMSLRPILRDAGVSDIGAGKRSVDF
ncbi:MAG: MFS transporter [Deltaproteobacteria bacterium]|nr:MFS transporter [Deltaproteobacteria bacterium]